jgi:hypothetical protein
MVYLTNEVDDEREDLLSTFNHPGYTEKPFLLISVRRVRQCLIPVKVPTIFVGTKRGLHVRNVAQGLNPFQIQLIELLDHSEDVNQVSPQPSRLLGGKVEAGEFCQVRYYCVVYGHGKIFDKGIELGDR